MQENNIFSDKLRTFSLIQLALAVIMSGCVGIPQQTQIIHEDLDQQVVAEATASDNSAFNPRSQQFSIDSTRINSENISVLNWNIYKGQKENWDEDLHRLIEDKDIVFLQEASLTDDLQEILKGQGMFWRLNNAFTYKGDETGVMTASKTRPLNTSGLRHIEPLIRTPKTILISRYQLSDTSKTLLVANIHGINFTLGVDAYKEQLEEMQGILAKHRGPLIVAGDFNNWSSERTAIMNEMADRLQLNRLECRSGKQTTVLGNSIDHIFYRGLEPLSSAALQVTSSDHNPITVQFRVADPKMAELEQ